jgi:hypothetical protein
MNTSPAPDVDRVLHRMGRSAFDYRSFPNPIEDAAPRGGIAAETPDDAPPAGVFSLVGEALPEAFKAVAVAPPAAVAPPPAPAPPMPPPAPPPLTTVPMPAAAAAAAPPANPFAPPMPPAPARAEAPAQGPRTTPLSHAFRILSGHAGAAPPWRDAGGQEPGFLFRRR